MADFWGMQNVLPEMDDDKGTPLVFVNSDRGKSMFNQINNNILYKEVDINQAVAYNSAAIKSVEQNAKREKFFENLPGTVDISKLITKYTKVSFSKKVYTKIRGLLSRVKKGILD